MSKRRSISDIVNEERRYEERRITDLTTTRPLVRIESRYSTRDKKYQLIGFDSNTCVIYVYERTFIEAARKFKEIYDKALAAAVIKRSVKW